MLPLIPTHPIEFAVDYPDRPLKRLSTLLRPVFGLPVLIMLAVLEGATLGGGGGDRLFLIGLGNGLLVLPPLLTIVSAGSTHGGGSTSTPPSYASTIG